MDKTTRKVKPLLLTDQVSAEQDHWNKTAEGLLRNLLWRIETGQIKPKEMAVAFIEYKSPDEPTGFASQAKRFTVENTDHSIERVVGLLEIAKTIKTDQLI